MSAASVYSEAKERGTSTTPTQAPSERTLEGVAAQSTRGGGGGGPRNEECRPAGELKGAVKEDGIRDGPKQVTAGRRAQERSFGGNHSHEDHSLPGKNAAIRRAWEGRHTRAPGRPSCQNAQKASLLYAPWLHLWASVQTQLSTQAGSLTEETGPWGSHT